MFLYRHRENLFSWDNSSSQNFLFPCHKSPFFHILFSTEYCLCFCKECTSTVTSNVTLLSYFILNRILPLFLQRVHVYCYVKCHPSIFYSQQNVAFVSAKSACLLLRQMSPFFYILFSTECCLCFCKECMSTVTSKKSKIIFIGICRVTTNKHFLSPALLKCFLISR